MPPSPCVLISRAVPYAFNTRAMPCSLLVAHALPCHAHCSCHATLLRVRVAGVAPAASRGP
eukprot:1898934-Lingulodinium_polyedra.AAC.1